MEKKSRTYRSIVAKINRHIDEHSWANTPLSRWYVGITNDPMRRKSEHQREFGLNIRDYAVFYAYTKKIASQVEDYFSKKGTSNCPGSRGAREDSRWVYVYKTPFLNL